jgi:hypothetical protein
MMLVWIGALLVIIGVVLTATRTLQRGRLSDPEAVRDTLEPKGSGRRLSVKADLPGIALIAIGSLLLLSVAI